MKYKLLSSLYYSDRDLYEQTYLNRYNSESTYRFNFNIGKNNAFLVINNVILKKIELIRDLDKDLLIIMKSVPAIALNQYAKKCLIDEITMTNEIEGVRSTRKEINDILNDKDNKNKHKRLFGVVKKYEMLLKDDDIKLVTCNDIRNLYDEFALTDVINENPENKPDGDIFRKERVYVYNKHQKVIHSGIYPESEIIKSMTNCLDILNNDEYDFLIRVAVFHYMFGYIHPFYDGNGRTSRFISSYLLSKKLEFLVSYRLSHTIHENLNVYYKSFDNTNDEKNKGDLTAFVITFLDFIIQSLNELIVTLTDKYNQLNYYAKIISTLSNKQSTVDLAYILIQNTLFGDEGLSIKGLQYVTTFGNNKVRQIVNELKELDLLTIDKIGNQLIYNIDLDKLENTSKSSV